MSRWLIEFQAIDPTDTSRSWTIGIDEALYRQLQVRGHDKQIARIMLVRETIEHPLRLIRGWSRPDKEDSYVYVGRPGHDYKSLSIETPAPKSMLFMVFVLPGGTIDEWTWRQQAEDDPNVPMGLNKGETIWNKQPPT